MKDVRKPLFRVHYKSDERNDNSDGPSMTWPPTTPPSSGKGKRRSNRDNDRRRKPITPIRLEEFLRRRARLQRVDEEVRRRIVLGFFDTLYYSRQFKKHKERKQAGRMTAVPQLDIPHIFVDDEDGSKQQTPTIRQSGQGKSTLLSAEDADRAHHRSWSGSSDLQGPGLDGGYQHPLSFPRSGPSSPSHQSATSAFSFELQEPGLGSGENSRRTSAVSPAQVSNILDDSVWVESIRRSATVRKPDWSNY
ncbi:hypothetical protein HYQ44_009740 [Verticillium longisporum]|nr:hypothetical protein HYQ44_009740 [Verticillium longisporum]